LQRVLSPDEHARAARFLNPIHGTQFAVGRGRLREILATELGERPERLPLSFEPDGKPTLSHITKAPHFNLSHTGHCAALAVTRAAPIGIDIETIRPIERDIAQRFFSAAENIVLESYGSSERIKAFYRCWTRKEAFVKARGDGLGFPLDAFDVSLDEATRPRIERIDGQPATDVARWHLHHLAESDIAPSIVGAIALQTLHADDQLIVTIRERFSEE
jgi:4'-phosphopantetheinyl transferase